jgi:anti-anti-sigma factor
VPGAGEDYSVVTTEDPPSELPHPASADNHDATGPSGTAASDAGDTAEDATLDAGSEMLGLTVERPASGVCVVTVNGELDMLTAPVLEACLREQLSIDLSHLVVDLQRVSFLDSKGLNCLLLAREATQTTATQLHLAGLVTRAVARPFQVSQLLELFTTYPTITQALGALLD